MVGDKEHPAGYGKSKREAKEEAAKIVYHEICGSETTEVSSNTAVCPGLIKALEKSRGKESIEMPVNNSSTAMKDFSDVVHTPIIESK